MPAAENVSGLRSIVEVLELDASPSWAQVTWVLVAWGLEFKRV